MFGVLQAARGLGGRAPRRAPARGVPAAESGGAGGDGASKPASKEARQKMIATLTAQLTDLEDVLGQWECLLAWAAEKETAFDATVLSRNYQ
jgi:hypothetical protein